MLLFVCDTVNKYLSKLYNDYWMLDNGFLEREQHGDLRDLILRPYSQKDTVVVAPTDLLVTAYQRMKLYEISQLPVMDGDGIVGIDRKSGVEGKRGSVMVDLGGRSYYNKKQKRMKAHHT